MRVAPCFSANRASTETGFTDYQTNTACLPRPATFSPRHAMHDRLQFSCARIEPPLRFAENRGAECKHVHYGSSARA